VVQYIDTPTISFDATLLKFTFFKIKKRSLCSNIHVVNYLRNLVHHFEVTIGSETPVLLLISVTIAGIKVLVEPLLDLTTKSLLRYVT
jgi:hypothetical protein